MNPIRVEEPAAPGNIEVLKRVKEKAGHLTAFLDDGFRNRLSGDRDRLIARGGGRSRRRTGKLVQDAFPEHLLGQLNFGARCGGAWCPALQQAAQLFLLSGGKILDLLDHLVERGWHLLSSL